MNYIINSFLQRSGVANRFEIFSGGLVWLAWIAFYISRSENVQNALGYIEVSNIVICFMEQHFNVIYSLL